MAADRAFIVAVLRPQRFATGATATADGVQLVDFHKTHDVTAAVYIRTAPWLAPTVLPVSETGVIPLPETLHASGPLVIELAVVDPWVASTWPDWPGEHSVTCARPGHQQGPDSGSEPLSRLLAGLELRLDDQLTDISAALTTYRLLTRLQLGDSRTGAVRCALDEVLHRDPGAVRCALDEVLHRDPGAALVAVARVAKDRAAVLELLIRTHLVERRFEGIALEDVASSWASSPVAAALGAAPRWADLTGDSIDDELTVGVALHGGTALVEVLSSGRDLHREVGVFGADAAIMSRMPARQVDELWKAAQIIPEGLLHPDSRVAAAKQLFDKRSAPGMTALCQLVAADLPRSRRTLRVAAPPAVLQQLDARLDGTPGDGWGLLPAASFAWAALARLRAQDPSLVPRMPTNRRGAWRTLARLAPDYVGLDLVLADALVQSTRRTTQVKAAT